MNDNTLVESNPSQSKSLRSEMSQTRKMGKIVNEDKSQQQIQIFKNPRDFSTHLPRHLVLQD